MTGLKTNERPGTRSQVRYVRMSASKARVVLDLVRNKHVAEASQILAFSERLASEVIMKCLRSAVANAEHNDDIPAEELYISACYADEGPTLKRFRPRARGRAGRIHKQTCHITIVVSRYSDEDLDELRRRAELRGASSSSSDSSADRRRRVAKSQAAAEETADDAVEEATDVVEDAAEDVVEDTVEETTDVVEDATSETTEVAETTSETDDMADTADADDAEATSSDERSDGAEETN